MNGENYFKFTRMIDSSTGLQCESSDMCIRVRVMMRLMQLREDSRIGITNQLSVASLLGALQFAYGFSRTTELDAHLLQQEAA